MTSLALAAAFFVGIHVVVSGTALRGAIAARVGENGFRGLFSIASLLGIVWMSLAYRDAPLVVLWDTPAALRWAILVLVLVAFVLVAVGLATPSPTAVGGDDRLAASAAGAEPARGILRVTRHPFLCGVAIWAAAHVLGNGNVASLVFFGAFALLGAIGPRLIDRKRRGLGERWERFAAVTSVVPFAAIAGGRNRFVAAEIGAVRVLAALALFALALAAHRPLFGASPLP